MEKKQEVGEEHHLAGFAEDEGLRTDPLRSEQFCAIKRLYTMNVYDSNAETEGCK